MPKPISESEKIARARGKFAKRIAKDPAWAEYKRRGAAARPAMLRKLQEIERSATEQFAALGLTFPQSAGAWQEMAVLLGERLEYAQNGEYTGRDLLRLAKLRAMGAEWKRNLGSDTTPTDLVKMRVAVQRFRVSRVTLKRAVAAGELHSYRSKNARSNAEHVFSERELAARYERHS